MKKHEYLRNWQKIIDPDPEIVWTSSENFLGYFSEFRPNGDGLEKVFDDFDYGKQILSRLLQIYSATSSNYHNVFGYFSIEKPEPMDPILITKTIKKYINNLMEIISLTDLNLANSLGEYHDLKVNSQKNEFSDVDTEVFDTIFDLILFRRTTKSPLLLLKDAFYSIANDYYLMFWITWPLYVEDFDISDPFLPYFQLWQHGIDISFDDESNTVNVYVPGNLK